MKNKIFLDLDGTLARFNTRNALNRFKSVEGFFLNLLPYKNIGTINELAKGRKCICNKCKPAFIC